MIEVHYSFLGVREELTQVLKLFVRNEVEGSLVHFRFAVVYSRGLEIL
jgi:hypothetical protein